MKARILLWLSLTTICLTTLACAPQIRVGPQESVETVYVYPGKPVRVEQNVKAKVRAEGAAHPTEQDLGGGWWMPDEHWQAVRRALNEYATLKEMAKTDPALAAAIAKAREAVKADEEKAKPKASP